MMSKRYQKTCGRRRSIQTKKREQTTSLECVLVSRNQLLDEKKC
jgi:hypothetical protein